MAFATKERARALASPTNADMTALRHLVRYYRTTSDLELRIQPKQELESQKANLNCCLLKPIATVIGLDIVIHDEAQAEE